ncbi:JAB domain-containing protein [Sphingosinithalassobacter portus]|uniref:JAB domain-containing protein n=1 Tax=Stakelama portus TaxID=2676234 RepID=UPI00196019DF|nr:JAB domain-containing protein [Sphingosinithalassobacter portus]
MTSLAFEAEKAAEARLLSGQDVARPLFRPIAEAREELAVFAYLDAEGNLLGMRHTPGESRDSCAIPVRDVAADALAFGAHAVVMAHNHPSGDPTPSRADREATNGLARALGPLDIRLVDHLVLARGGAVSFRALGWL